MFVIDEERLYGKRRYIEMLGGILLLFVREIIVQKTKQRINGAKELTGKGTLQFLPVRIRTGRRMQQFVVVVQKTIGEEAGNGKPTPLFPSGPQHNAPPSGTLVIECKVKSDTPRWVWPGQNLFTDTA